MAGALEPLSEAEAADMIRRLRDREAASREAARIARERQSKEKGSTPDEADAGEQIDWARLLLTAGRFSSAEYVFYVAAQAEHILDRRCFAGAYDAELKPISAAIEEIERAHGLEEDECFGLDEGPEEWRALNRAYEAVLDDKLEELLAELGLSDLAALHHEDNERFRRLRETGRLAFFSESGVEANIRNLIKVYEYETRCAATSGAYLAAMMTLACATEARLVLHCIRRPDAASSAAQRVAGKARPRNADPLSWTVDQLVIVAHAGGWLHNLPDARLVTAVAIWLESLPERRPGQQVLGGRQPMLAKSDFEAARDAYAALRYSLDLAADCSETGATVQ
jgi:hypothetical protein